MELARHLRRTDAGGKLDPVIDDLAKAYLHSDLREVRATMLWKLDGVSEYNIRRP